VTVLTYSTKRVMRILRIGNLMQEMREEGPAKPNQSRFREILRAHQGIIMEANSSRKSLWPSASASQESFSHGLGSEGLSADRRLSGL